MKLSIIIPTYNRLGILKKVIASIDRQLDGSKDIEVIVINDGSSDLTAEHLDSITPSFRLRHETQEQGGPARARNRGIRMAEGERIAFLGDDTIPGPGCISEHVQEPNSRAVAVLGYTTWHEELNVTPFMDYINRFGLQFGYDIIPDPERVPFNFFYTSNVSLPASVIRDAGGFDESFPFAAWEDIECAYRMMKRNGLRMVYRPGATCYHHHPTSISSFSIRQFKSGIAAATMYQKHPELGDFLGVPLIPSPGKNRSLSLPIMERICRLMEQVSWFKPRTWYRQIMENHYLRGLSEGLERHGYNHHKDK